MLVRGGDFAVVQLACEGLPVVTVDGVGRGGAVGDASTFDLQPAVLRPRALPCRAANSRFSRQIYAVRRRVGEAEAELAL